MTNTDPFAAIYAAIENGTFVAPAPRAAKQAPRATFDPTDPSHKACRRCSGSRVIAAFKHVENGVCFGCGGTGLRAD
jgi:hypothetical protein